MSTLQFKDFIKESDGEKSLSLSDLPRQFKDPGTYIMGNKINLTDNFAIMADSKIIEQGKLKYPFGKAASFDVSKCNLKTLENFPEVVDGHLLAHVNNLSSIDYFPREVTGMIDLSCNTNLISLKRLDSFLKKCGNTEIVLPATLKSHLLCVMKIPGVYRISVDETETYSNPVPELSKAIDIINKYIFKDKNIAAAQTELLRNGLKEYAKL
jgi:hypothetical protein